MFSEASKTHVEKQEPAQVPPAAPRLIELVGVAGTGKSTLLKALSHRNGRIQELPPPNKLRYLPTMLKVIFRWLPLYLLKYRRGRWFTWEETRKLGYLDVWLGYIRSEIRTRNLIVALNPGSMCWLVALRQFGPDLTKDPQFQEWWEGRVRLWAAALDVIIWMEAPIELSLQRVLGREEEHEAKSEPVEVALEEFERYRRAYIELVPEMARRGEAQLFHYRSDQMTTDHMAAEIFHSSNLA